MMLRDHAIRYGFIVLLFGLIAYFAVAADGFVSPQSAVFIFQSVAITG
ncbi:MAG: ABC transporter permease, partial [Mesorhizobium sp.]